RDVMELHPSAAPVPWRWVAPLLGLSTGAMAGALVLPDDLRKGVVLVVFTSLAWALGGLRHRAAFAVLGFEHRGRHGVSLRPAGLA
ncbi:MAG: hypothetical protein ACK4F7_09165, partial [Inhella sp.]